MKEKLASLYELQKIDTELASVVKKYGALDTAAAEEEAAKSAAARAAEATAELHTAQTSLRDAELEQRSIEEKRVEFEGKLYGGKVRIAKELQALQQEIEMLGRQRSALDDKILQLMDEIEALKVAERQAADEAKRTDAKFREKRAVYVERAGGLSALARRVNETRAPAAAAVDPALLARYEALKKARGGTAIVTLDEGGICGGCKMAVTPTVVRRVRVGDTVELCDNCHRMLWAGPDGKRAGA